MTGGWAATSTLREAIHDRGMDAWEEERPVDPKHAAALALVETALDDTSGLVDWLLSMDDPEDVLGREERREVTLTKIIERACLAASALRAVREGTQA